jgi:magnesium transporter
MMRMLFSKMDGMVTREIDPAHCGRVIADPNNLAWVDLDCPTPAEIEVLRREFGFHELAIEDAVKHSQRPKIDTYDSFYLLVLYAVTFDEAELRIDEHELDVFVGQNYLVPVHEGAIEELDEVARRWERNSTAMDPSVGVLLYSLIDTLVDDYLPIMDRISDLIEEIQEAVFDHYDPQAQARIFALRRELLNLRRILGPERDVVLRLSRRELPILAPNTSVYFQDVYDHVARATDSVDMYRELLSSVLDSYLSASSNNLNLIFRTLTSVSIILMSLSLIAGIYGMNFNPEVSPFSMPELNARFGYPATLLLMLGVALALYAVFRRKRWL